MSHEAISQRPRRRRAPAHIARVNDYELRPQWLATTQEEIIEPDLPIIDPHHHLWDRNWRYLLDELLDDVDGGHNVEATVYIQCNSMLRADAEPALASLGETEFVNGVAAMAASGAYGPIAACAGIVGYVDLTLEDRVAPLLDKHIQVSDGRLRGIRNSSARDADPSIVSMRQLPPEGLLLDARFRRGFANLAARNLAFDAWLYHPQINELADLAKAFPDTTIVLDHVGAPLGIRAYAGRRANVFATWRADIQALAKLPNVYVKLGGLGMPIMGFAFEAADKAPSSQELATAWAPYFDTCIEAFGVERCMFESNFPVDKQSCSYNVLWNAFKRHAKSCSPAEKAALFHDTAARIYRL